MSEFEILDDPRHACYMLVPDDGSSTREDHNKYKYFRDNIRKDFLNEIKKHEEIKKQAGYSKKRDCNYISIILIAHYLGDGEFVGHGIASTCLVEKNGIITDSNNNTEYQQHGIAYNMIYHHLPDGKVLEYQIKGIYENNLETIYHDILKIRSYHQLNYELPEKEVAQKVKRVKI